MKNYQSDQKTNNKSDCMHVNLQNLIISNTGIMDQESDRSEKSKLGANVVVQAGASYFWNFWTCLRSEVKIYKRKQESKKKRKKTCSRLRNRSRKKERLSFFLGRCFGRERFFFLFFWSMAWSKVCFLVFFYKFPPQIWKKDFRFMVDDPIAYGQIWIFKTLTSPLLDSASAFWSSIPLFRTWI